MAVTVAICNLKQTEETPLKDYYSQWHFEKHFIASFSEEGVCNHPVYALLTNLDSLLSFICVYQKQMKILQNNRFYFPISVPEGLRKLVFGDDFANFLNVLQINVWKAHRRVLDLEI